MFPGFNCNTNKTPNTDYGKQTLHTQPEKP